MTIVPLPLPEPVVSPDELSLSIFSPPPQPENALPLLSDYAKAWLESLHHLTPQGKRSLEIEVRLRLVPAFGQFRLNEVTPVMVREWYERSRAVMPARTARAYSTLRRIFALAVDEELLDRNPARLRKGGVPPRPAERPVVTPADLDRIVAALPDRYRLVALLAAWCQLRRGEIFGLQRHDIDLERGVVHVRRSAVDVDRHGDRVYGPTKTLAGVRTVTIPRHIIPALQRHLDVYVGEQSESLLFTNKNGRPMTGHGFGVPWAIARGIAGFPELHLHDLRHSGNTWVASTGIPLRDLMHRMGHSSQRAALGYLHRYGDGDRHVAEALEAMAIDEDCGE